MKLSKTKLIVITIILIPILFIGFSYLKFLTLDVYSMSDSEITYQDRSYKADTALFKQLLNDELEMGEVIGKVGDSKGLDDWLFGFRVYKIKGFNEYEAIRIKGLMFDDVFMAIK